MLHTNKASLLLVALIATAMHVQADPITSIKSLLARMQNNAIARQITARRVGYLVLGAGAIATTAGLWWWLKNRGVSQQVESGKGTSLSQPLGDSASRSEPQTVASASSTQAPDRSPVTPLQETPLPVQNQPLGSAVGDPQPVSVANASSTQESDRPPVAPLQPLPLANLSASGQKTPFHVQENMRSWQELPGILQRVLGDDLSKTAIVYPFYCMIGHNIYTLKNRKKLNLLLYERYGVKPDLFSKLRKENHATDNSFPLAYYVLQKHPDSYSQEDRDAFYNAYTKRTSVSSAYMENWETIKQVMVYLHDKAAYTGVGSKEIIEEKRKNKVGHDVNTYVLVDNDQKNVKDFIEKAEQEGINALGIYYTRVDDMVTEDALREEIRSLSPDYCPAGAAK